MASLLVLGAHEVAPSIVLQAAVPDLGYTTSAHRRLARLRRRHFLLVSGGQYAPYYLLPRPRFSTTFWSRVAVDVAGGRWADGTYPHFRLHSIERIAVITA
jgi:hypothetical protein